MGESSETSSMFFFTTLVVVQHPQSGFYPLGILVLWITPLLQSFLNPSGLLFTLFSPASPLRMGSKGRLYSFPIVSGLFNLLG
jgi:hypothetical protein